MTTPNNNNNNNNNNNANTTQSQPSAPPDAPAVSTTTPTPFSLHDEDEAELANFDMYIDPTSNPSSSTPQSSQQSNLQILSTAFPSIPSDTISAVLVACDHDLKSARRTLQASVSSTSHDNTQPNQQQQKHVSPTSSDAAIAVYLQRQESILAARAKSSSSSSSSSSSPSPSPSSPSIQLAPDVMQRVLNSIQQIVIPALLAHFSELILPDTRQETRTLLYELKQVQVVALSLPTDHVSVKSSLDRRSILINVVNANLELQVGQWHYENKSSVLPVSDNGRARASVHAINIDLRLRPVRQLQFEIDQCHVSVDGVVRFKTHGAAADWAYNAIAVVIKPWLVSYVKESVADAVVKAFKTLLRQLESASDLSQTQAQTQTSAQTQTHQNEQDVNNTATSSSTTVPEQPSVSASE